LRAEGIAAGLAAGWLAVDVGAARREWKGPRSGGVERRPTKRCYARSIARPGPEQQGENPEPDRQLKP